MSTAHAVLKSRPQDAVFAQTQFLKKPLHWGMWSAVNDLLWLERSHRIALTRIRPLLCMNTAHRGALAEVIAEHFQVDAEGFVHCPALTARHATDLANYRQKVDAGRSGGVASSKVRSAAAKAPNPGSEDF